MTKEEHALASAIIDQLNAELGASTLSVLELSKRLGRPYDSTRNYLRKERALPFGIFLEIADLLEIRPEEIISRARARIQ
ncbi:hypothetical protein [Leucobacter japonicus]|uniref:hypothetical protein n=1 Tax=Leucobacter japonicus TaxID=1461259 RepID=UPI0006A78F44|nr:hypothetical protein [Leucobacter japonicus]